MEKEGSSLVGVESRARELRRRAANRRRVGIDILSSSSPVQTLSLPQLFYAKQEAHEIRMELIDIQAQHNAALTYCDQQFVVEKNVRQLRKSIGVAQLQIRQKTEELDALQRRVLRLSSTLHDSSDEKTFAKTKLVNQEEIRKHQLQAKPCRHCQRHYLPGMLIAHENNCVGPIARTNQLADSWELLSGSRSVSVIRKASATPDAPKLTKFVSQPPRNLRVDLKTITHNALTIRWDPPIFTGSSAIFDYELNYSICHTKVKLGAVQCQCDPQPPLRLSRWCLSNPVPANHYRLTGLSADKEYGELSICAITVAGKSEESNKLEFVQTLPAVPPTIPLFLCVGVVTATTITLTWMEPLDNGGNMIQDYEVIFSEAIIKLDNVDDRGKGWLDVSEIEYKPRRIRTNSPGTSLTIVNLLSGVEHLNFQVRAVNTEGIQGDYCESIKSIFTIAPGNEFKLLDELQAAVNSRSRTVDSQFLSGFMQRYERHHYIEQVSRFILSTRPELEAKVSGIVHRGDSILLSEEGITEQGTEPSPIQPATRRKRFEDLTYEEKVAERRRQFHFRIAEIRADQKKAEYNVQWCKDRQIDLVALIRAAETRILEKQAELERARMFKGAQMDSDVLENGLQRFFTKELVVALEDEIEIDQLYILDTKAEIVKVENYLRADIKRRETLMTRLKERQEALEVFESNPEYAETATGTAATLAKLRGGTLYRAFAAFVSNRQEAHEIRRKMRAAINRLVNHRLKSAIQRWREVAKFLTRTNGVDGIYGIGSLGLLNAALGRDDLMIEAQNLLHELRSTESSLQNTRWTTEQQVAAKNECSASKGDTELEQSREQNKKYFPFILEGDSKMNLQEHEDALRLYSIVANNEEWVQQMSEEQQIQLQLKIGEATFRLEKYEQALTMFNRVSVAANRMGLRYEEGSAILRAADTQHVLRSLRMSIDSYERALLLFEAVRDAQGELACYRGLQHVYERLEDREMIEINKLHADDIEFVLTKKLSSAVQKINKIQQRLVGAGAESSCQIALERVGPIVPRLRRERIQRKFDIREEAKLVASLEKLLEEKKVLLAKGEDDLKRALASDSSQVDSAIINGSGARYELDDFKTKLAKLMGSVKAGEEQIGKDITNAKIRISNAEDEIKGLEEELAVETGALMRKVVSRDRLRCFRFNATNESLKNVVGTASHGITTCFASAGVNGFVFDSLSGACLAQAVGDPQQNHLGDPTGHQAQILCVYYIGHRIYTGSVDSSLGVWEVRTEAIGGVSCSLLRMLTDFDAAVVSIVADTQWFACSCSDRDVFVFDVESLATIVHIITAHDKTVTTLSLQSAKLSLTTGGADHKIKVWEVGQASQYTMRRNVKLVWCLEAERRGDEFFNGHLVPVTCVRRVANEIVSGDSSGRVVVWNLDADNKLLRICDVHRDVVVTCLQFDATRIVSGASNGHICVIDFATGNLIQTLYAHQESVLDLQFDRTRLISMSADGKVQLWFWQTRDGIGANRKKYHILGAGETLRSLSLMYRTSVQKLLQWNSIPDSTKTYLGQKLIVEVDANASASDELKTLDLSSSVQFGKLSYENLDFVASNKSKSKDVESQWAAQRLAMLAKEYFPSLDDEVRTSTEEKEDGVVEAQDESESDDDMAMDSITEADEQEQDQELD